MSLVRAGELLDSESTFREIRSSLPSRATEEKTAVTPPRSRQGILRPKFFLHHLGELTAPALTTPSTN
jgi:hypothetical protein